MHGLRSVLASGRVRVLRGLGYSSLAFGLLSASGCEEGLGQLRPGVPAEGGAGGAAGAAGAAAGGSVGNAGSLGSAGTLFIGDPNAPNVDCVPAEELHGPLFANDMVITGVPAHKVLYSWTTPEHIEQLRADQVLLITGEQAGAGRGYALDVLDSIAASQKAGAQLAAAVSTSFAKIRYGWPTAWATRLGYPGEDYGDQLVRMVLKDEAWILMITGGELSVIDLQGGWVTLEQAFAEPERIGAIFFSKDSEVGGPVCGTFGGGGPAYREFIVGNEAMIEEWSLATLEMRATLEASVVQLRDFVKTMSAEPLLVPPADWLSSLMCGYTFGGLCETSGLAAYDASLAAPSELYYPSPAVLEGLIETLEADLFEPDPLVVRPSTP